METQPRFHLSLLTADLDRQRAFYVDVLGCKLARTTAAFEDYDFYGHQLTFHLRPRALELPYADFHFGALVSCQEFERVSARLSDLGATFIIEPTQQAVGTVDERRKLVVLDPSGYALELKCYVDETRALVREQAYPRVPASGGQSS
jgi:extradiol dioxygenase family protein